MTISQNGSTDLPSNSWQNDFLIEKLHAGVVNVKFVKKDGTDRSMRCTLNNQYLPERTVSDSTRAENPEVLCVWDLGKDAWRSFRWDSLVGFSETDQ